MGDQPHNQDGLDEAQLQRLRDGDDEVFAITASGGVIRSPVADVRQSGRDTMGVILINLKDEDAVVTVARNAERDAAAAGAPVDENDGEGNDGEAG